MKKEYFVVIISAIVAIALLATAIYIGEAHAAELERISRVEKVLERTAELSGYKSLGVIDAYAISKKNGMLYDGPGITAELYNRAGLTEPFNCWSFTFDTFDDVTLMKFVVYEGEQTEPVWEQEIKQVYLYGVL